MLSLENKNYTAALRWKKGEMEALHGLDEASKDRLLPHVILPPLNARDIEKKRKLSRDEFSRIQVGRLQTFWSGRPCLLDFRFLQFDPTDRGSDAAWISEFLSVSQKFGCRVIPVLSPQTDGYRAGVMAAYIRSSGCGGAIRIDLNDLQNDKLSEMLGAVLAGARLSASECILVLDLAEATISDINAFSKFVSEWLSKLRHFGTWKRIVVEASSYPVKNPAMPNREATASRTEWLAWQQLVREDRSILDWVSFGDFGADHGHIDFEGGGRTIKHFRYARLEDWIIFRGGEPTEKYDGSIHSVAKRLIETGGFLGDTYSAGDEFITLCAERTATGNGSTWRFANMVHHLTMATAGVAELVGAPFERAIRAPIARQLALLE